MSKSLVAFALFTLAPGVALAQMSGEALKDMKLEKVSISSAVLVPEGPEPKLPGNFGSGTRQEDR